jgi:hypothetical protein
MNPVLGDWAPSDSGPWITEWDAENSIPHVMPDFGPKHAASILCWCHPVLDTVMPSVSHNVAQ